ncbi:MAG TPA: DUF6602 domain-containing protein [Chthoniobacterales bacterium]|nr:DUF6602 domain-containing protein [Chthoniobacterales bacterium]
MVKKKKSPKVNLGKIFLGLQKEMVAQLRTARRNVNHPTSKGNVSENKWRRLLKDYLPGRYQVAEAFVVDCDGNISEQLDLVIFDRQYSPFLFYVDGACYIPAESVYAVFEIKQDATKERIEYAAKKIASVRRLKRTSAKIPHAGGRYAPIKPKEIIGGFVCLTGGTQFCAPKKFSSVLKNLSGIRRIHLACILQRGAFAVTFGRRGKASVTSFPATQALIQFFLSLLSMLQHVGTVPAMEFKSYSAALRHS